MSKLAFTVSACPTCGSRRIERVCGKWKGSYKDESYEVPDLEYHSCPDCGEKVYPPEAMRRIQQASPAYSPQRTRPQARLARNVG